VEVTPIPLEGVVGVLFLCCGVCWLCGVCLWGSGVSEFSIFVGGNMGFCETVYPQLLLHRTPQVSKVYAPICESFSKARPNSDLRLLDKLSLEEGGYFLSCGYVYDC